jgi:IS30 family transposase
LIDKSAPLVADAIFYFFLAGHTMQICQNDNGSEFKGALCLVMKRFGVKVINSRPRHPESQGMNEQSNGFVHSKIDDPMEKD